jgi:hypothetical protein
LHRVRAQHLENTERSKSLDDSINIRGTVGSDFSPQNALCPATCEYGPSDFNIPHRFVASVLLHAALLVVASVF